MNGFKIMSLEALKAHSRQNVYLIGDTVRDAFPQYETGVSSALSCLLFVNVDLQWEPTLLLCTVDL